MPVLPINKPAFFYHKFSGYHAIHMTTLHSEKTEAFYQKVLKINLDAAMHSSRAFGLEEPLEQLRLEAEWSADEVIKV